MTPLSHPRAALPLPLAGEGWGGGKHASPPTTADGLLPALAPSLTLPRKREREWDGASLTRTRLNSALARTTLKGSSLTGTRHD